MPSYLEDSYLGGLNEEFSDLGAENATSALTPAPGEEPHVAAASSDLVTLPGGITMPKKTLWVVLSVLALVALVKYLRKREQRLAALEHRAEGSDE